MEDYTYIMIADPKYNRFVKVLVDACECGNSETFESSFVNRDVFARCIQCGNERHVGDLEPSSLPKHWKQYTSEGERSVVTEASDGR